VEIGRNAVEASPGKKFKRPHIKQWLELSSIHLSSQLHSEAQRGGSSPCQLGIKQDLISKMTNTEKVCGVAQVVEHLNLYLTVKAKIITLSDVVSNASGRNI
jgi:hypothetical protein